MSVRSTKSNSSSDPALGSGIKGVDLELRGAVALVTLARAPVNALEGQVAARIAELTDLIRADARVGAVVVRGSAQTFSAGADLRAIAALLATEGADAAADLVARLQGMLAELADLPVPTVAAIRGAALGGGLELALACDLRVAASPAKIGFPEIRHGLLPGLGGTQRITRVAGPGVAARLALTGEILDGEAAQRLGVVQWALPDAEVEPFALDLAERLAAAPVATAAVKRCIDLAPSEAGFEHERRATRQLYASQEVQRRVADF